ncbi:MAG: hypothetical protein IPK99_04080 [Flavobacteriales bacterium]|nr:hypothetical protein [Flavobacteriales bacterium]
MRLRFGLVTCAGLGLLLFFIRGSPGTGSLGSIVVLRFRSGWPAGVLAFYVFAFLLIGGRSSFLTVVEPCSFGGFAIAVGVVPVLFWVVLGVVPVFSLRSCHGRGY